MIDPYVDRETGVLCNRLGLTDAAALQGAETIVDASGCANAQLSLPGAGWFLDWSQLDPEANVAASVAAVNGNYAPLERVLGPVVIARHEA